MATSITLDDIVFNDTDFDGAGYKTLVEVNGVRYPRWQALFVAGMRQLSKELSATSTTEETVTTSGNIQLTLESDVLIREGTVVTVARTSDPSGVNMFGTVIAYNSVTRVIDIAVVSGVGAGTYSDWTVTMSGPRGTFAAVPAIRSSNTVLAQADTGKAVIATSAFTQTITAKANLSAGWLVMYKNASTGNIIIDPNSAETIEGLATFTLLPGESAYLYYDGTDLRVLHHYTPNGFLGSTINGAVADGDYVHSNYMPFPGIVDQTGFILTSGTCTAVPKINTTAIAGGSHSVSSTVSEITRSSDNAFVKGDKLQFTISAQSSANTLSYWFRIRRY